MSGQFYYEIATGRVPKTTGRTLKTSIITSIGGLDLHPDPGSRFLDGPAERIAITSSDSRDNAAGDGLRLLLLYGLDNDLKWQVEFVPTHPTNGTLPSYTTQTFKRLSGAVSMQAGLVSNIGTITLAMEGGLWLGQILPIEGRTRLDTYTVPYGYMSSITLVRYHVEKLGLKDGSVRIQGRVRGRSFQPYDAWNHTFSGWCDSSAQPHVTAVQPIPFQFESGTDLLLDFETNDANLRVHLDLVVVEEKDEWNYPEPV